MEANGRAIVAGVQPGGERWASPGEAWEVVPSEPDPPTSASESSLLTSDASSSESDTRGSSESPLISQGRAKALSTRRHRDLTSAASATRLLRLVSASPIISDNIPSGADILRLAVDMRRLVIATDGSDDFDDDDFDDDDDDGENDDDDEDDDDLYGDVGDGSDCNTGVPSASSETETSDSSTGSGAEPSESVSSSGASSDLPDSASDCVVSSSRSSSSKRRQCSSGCSSTSSFSESGSTTGTSSVTGSSPAGSTTTSSATSSSSDSTSSSSSYGSSSVSPSFSSSEDDEGFRIKSASFVESSGGSD